VFFFCKLGFVIIKFLKLSALQDSEDDEKPEETEEQFLERYAQKAQELEKEAREEAEGGEEEDGQELEIGKIRLRAFYSWVCFSIHPWFSDAIEMCFGGK
jgi:hypothetical protein